MASRTHTAIGMVCDLATLVTCAAIDVGQLSA